LLSAVSEHVIIIIIIIVIIVDVIMSELLSVTGRSSRPHVMVAVRLALAAVEPNSRSRVDNCTATSLRLSHSCCSSFDASQLDHAANCKL